MKHQILQTVIHLYLLFGITWICLGKTYPKWFVVLTMFFGFKWIFNYRKCTISYLECKIRGVKRKDGYLNNLLDHIIDFRYDARIKYVIFFQVCFLTYQSYTVGLFNDDLF